MFDMVPYQAVLMLHLVALGWSVCGIIAADGQGLRWLFGWVPVVRASYLRLWHRWVFIGLGTSYATGLYMFWPLRDYLMTEPIFLLKIAFVLILTLNAFFIGSHLLLASQQPFAALQLKQRRTLLASGLVSTSCWVAIVLLGLLLPV